LFVFAMMLPADLLIPVFSALGTTKELGRCAQVCRAFRRAIISEEEEEDEAEAQQGQQSLWKEIAVRIYGAALAESTVSLYQGNNSYREMVKDDNRRGASPAFPTNVACLYRFNRDEYYFCCLVVSVVFDRLAGSSIWVHLDARGETDLRHPSGSVVFRNNRIVRADEWRTEMRAERPGHFKGRLRFNIPPNFLEPNNDGDEPGISFCYAHTLFHHALADYSFVHLINVDALRDSKKWKTFLGRDGSPFRDDTPQVERERWAPWIPESVMNRAASLLIDPWWVEPNDG
jgi:F-box-like